MRLREIERGDGFSNRLLIGFISVISRMRLPDAARVAFYHKGFFSAPMGAWTQAAMRGPSEWSVGERELMAAMVAKWNSCPFCVGAHGAVAARTMERPLVEAVLADFRSAPISEPLKGALAFLEIMTLRPFELAPEHAPLKGIHRGSEGRYCSGNAVQHHHAVCRCARLRHPVG